MKPPIANPVIPDDDLARLHTVAERFLPFVRLLPDDCRSLAMDVLTEILLGSIPYVKYSDSYEFAYNMAGPVRDAGRVFSSICWVLYWAHHPEDHERCRPGDGSYYIPFNLSNANRELAALESLPKV